jgi:hypothetical protein
MDRPPGYVTVPCPHCRTPFTTPENTPAFYCSLACAEAAQRPRPPLLRAVRVFD